MFRTANQALDDNYDDDADDDDSVKREELKQIVV